MTSPLQIEHYLALSDMTKEELIALCISLSDELGEIGLKKREAALKKAQSKRDSYIKEVRVKVFEVFVDLTNECFPSYKEMELELNRRFPEKKWVYDDTVPPERGEQGFYRPLLSVKKYLEFLIKHQIEL